MLSAYIADTYIGSQGWDRLGTHVSKIVMASNTQSDHESYRIESERWGKTGIFLCKQIPVCLIFEIFTNFGEREKRRPPQRIKLNSKGLTMPEEIQQKLWRAECGLPNRLGRGVMRCRSIYSPSVLARRQE
jgi:hypothetical protein